MADKVPVKATYDSAGDADGLSEYVSGDTLGVAHGGTGLAAVGSAGQVLRTNSAANAIEWGAAELINIDGMTDGSSITIADTDDFAISDGGTEKKINASQIKSYIGTPLSLIDEDDLSSDSATRPPSQQSVKAYVDAAIKTEEEIEDFVGGMLGGTETFITVTYQDGTGDIDFVVPVQDEDDMSSNSAAHLATQQSIKAYADGLVTGYKTEEQIEDIVGAMFSSNTETNITATYQDSDGTIDLVVPGGGKILQVVTGTTTTDTGAEADATFEDTGLTADITCSATSSKVLVLIHQTLQFSRDTTEQFGYYRLLRDSTEVGEWYYLAGANLQGAGPSPIATVVMDSPSSTSALTYKTQARVETTANNGTWRANQQSTSGESPASIQLIEIGA